MILAWYLGMALPFSTHLFTPTTLVEQVQNTPILILAALQFSLALAYLARGDLRKMHGQVLRHPRQRGTRPCGGA
jgi:hypothetical protein